MQIDPSCVAGSRERTHSGRERAHPVHCLHVPASGTTMPRYLPRRGLNSFLKSLVEFGWRVGANGAAGREFYGILNAAGGLSRFAACDTGSFPERRMALFERNHCHRSIYELRMEPGPLKTDISVCSPTHCLV